MVKTRFAQEEEKRDEELLSESEKEAKIVQYKGFLQGLQQDLLALSEARYVAR